MKKKGIQIEDILKLHNEGLSPIQIASKLDCSLTNISKRLRKKGIEPIRTIKTWARKNRYHIDESFFEKINTEAKAYFLGLMYADGSVFKDGFYLKMKDEDILITFKKVLKAEQNVKYRNYDNYYSYQLFISSQKMSEDLVNKGCFINKTYTLKFPTEEQVPKELQRHFIRGYFDGDGSLSLSNNISTCRIDFTSASTDILKELRKIIATKAISTGSLSKESGKSNTWHLRFGGKQVKQLLEWFYKSSTVFLKRKYDKFLMYNTVQLKSDELLEKPEEVNQQPSLELKAL